MHEPASLSELAPWIGRDFYTLYQAASVCAGYVPSFGSIPADEQQWPPELARKMDQVTSWRDRLMRAILVVEHARINGVKKVYPYPDRRGLVAGPDYEPGTDEATWERDCCIPGVALDVWVHANLPPDAIPLVFRRPRQATDEPSPAVRPAAKLDAPADLADEPLRPQTRKSFNLLQAIFAALCEHDKRFSAAGGRVEDAAKSIAKDLEQYGFDPRPIAMHLVQGLEQLGKIAKKRGDK